MFADGTPDELTDSQTLEHVMRHRPTVTLSICADCVQLLANSECSPDRSPELPEPLSLLAGADVALGGDDLGFATSSCDGCGDHHDGDRFTATQFLVSMTKGLDPAYYGLEPMLERASARALASLGPIGLV